MKKVTVVIPVYNGKKRIKKCIDSVLSQTYKNTEIIVFDDGSKDGSYEYLIETYSKTKPENLLFIKKENEGVAKTRNRGIQMASGEYIAFIDQDDYILPTYLEEYMGKVEETDAEIVVGGYKRISDEGVVSRTVQLDDTEWAKMVVTAPWAHVYKTSCLKENNVEFLSTGLGEDIYFNLLAYSYAENVCTIPSVSYMWVDNPISVSNSKQNTISEDRSPLFLLNELKAHLPAENKMGNNFIEYYFVRYVAWYFLYTFRGSKTENLVSMYEKVMKWLKDSYPNYRKNPYMKLSRPKGDPVFIRCSVFVFYSLEKVRLLLPIMKLFTKR